MHRIESWEGIEHDALYWHMWRAVAPADVNYVMTGDCEVLFDWAVEFAWHFVELVCGGSYARGRLQSVVMSFVAPVLIGDVILIAVDDIEATKDGWHIKLKLGKMRLEDREIKRVAKAEFVLFRENWASARLEKFVHDVLAELIQPVMFAANRDHVLPGNWKYATTKVELIFHGPVFRDSSHGHQVVERENERTPSKRRVYEANLWAPDSQKTQVSSTITLTSVDHENKPTVPPSN